MHERADLISHLSRHQQSGDGSGTALIFLQKVSPLGKQMESRYGPRGGG